jgi:hypothetical protein
MSNIDTGSRIRDVSQRLGPRRAGDLPIPRRRAK